MNDNLIFAISVLVAIVLWLFTKDQISAYFKNLFKKLDTSIVNELENKGLIVEHKELLNDSAIVKKNKFIFWPVVPTDSPNLIHAISIYYLNKLSESGFKVVVFVFDSYYQTIKEKEDKILKQEINKFIKDLKKLGLCKRNLKLVKESNCTNIKKKKTKFVKKFYTYLGELKYGQFQKINEIKDYLNSETPTIRFFKPILNMVYLKILPYEFGFTFSGYDEKELWETFILHLKDGRGSLRLTNLYIPILKKINSNKGKTDVLDKCENITVDDSINDIINKISQNDNCLLKGELVGYAIDVLVFNGKGKIEIKLENGDVRPFTGIEHIANTIKESPELKDLIIDSVSKKLYECIHQK